jgi:hypothetical protein
VVRLQPQEKPFGQSKIAGEPQVGIGRHDPLSEDDFVDAARRHMNGAGKAILAQRHRPQEIVQQDFARMRIGQEIAVNDSLRFRHCLPHLPAM